MTKKFKEIALEKLLPGSWYMNTDDTHGFLVDTDISEEDVIAKTVEVQYYYEVKEYQRKRKAEYPDYAYYLDGVVKGDQDQIDAYIAACQAVKDKYPKVEVDETELASRQAQALFDYQLEEYTKAQARLAQHQVALGRAEVTESQATGERIWNEETDEMDDVMTDIVTVTAIDPVEATVEQTTYDADGVATTVTVENPLITADVAERATAQAIVDATPQAVIDTYNGE
jgi:hypothetical protein